MRSLRFLLIKEFKQIFRNKTLLPLIFVLPIVQLLLMPLAADYEIKNINIVIVDHDHSSFSRDLTSKIVASNYFNLVAAPSSYQDAFTYVESDEADLILELPYHFEHDIAHNGQAKLLIAVNAINGTKASLGGAYLSAIIAEFNKNIDTRLFPAQGALSFKSIEVSTRYWFNPYLNYKIFMVPAILVILVTMVGAYMCGLNIVKEKEIGTIEQINVSPIKKHHYILGKLIPFWIIGLIVFSIGFFGVSWLVYGIVPLGSILLVYAYLALFLIAILGFGLLISTFSDTQQQAMSVSFFFMMIFILMSGLFTPIDSMPPWAKVITDFNPVTYFIEVMRMVVLKGSGLVHITKHIIVMIGFALFFNVWAIINYRKTN